MSLLLLRSLPIKQTASMFRSTPPAATTTRCLQCLPAKVRSLSSSQATLSPPTAAPTARPSWSPIAAEEGDASQAWGYVALGLFVAANAFVIWAEVSDARARKQKQIKQSERMASSGQDQLGAHLGLVLAQSSKRAVR